MNSTKNKYRLAYFVSHPIQYQAPLLKLISEQKDIDLTVFFLSNISTGKYKDSGFGQRIKWDIPLLDGYQYEFLQSTTSTGDFTLNNPNVAFRSVKKALLSQSWDAVWLHGYANFGLLYAVYLCSQYKIPLFLRGESNLICSRHGIIKNWFIRSLLKRCNALLSIGSENRAYYQHYGVANNKIFSVPYAVDNKTFQLPPTLPTSPSILKEKGKTIILFASKFIERKKPLLLMQAYSELDKHLKDKSQLWFIGGGEQQETMQQFIVQNNLQASIKLLGFKNQSELPWYYSQCDLFVLASEKEPFGLVINEVMNQSKAIITSNEVGAAADLIKHGENGWVVKAGSKMQLRTALSEALNNPCNLITMGRKSFQQITTWNYEADIHGIRSALNSLH